MIVIFTAADLLLHWNNWDLLHDVLDKKNQH